MTPHPSHPTETVSRRALLKASALVGVTAAAPVRGARDPPTEIRSATTITQPGVYTLVDDVSVTSFDGIRIEADDVTLEGRGHALTLDEATRRRFEAMVIPSRGDRMYGTGVGTTEPVRNVTITDLTVSTWDTGIRLENVTDGSVENVTAVDNVDGIALEGAVDSSVTASTAARNYEEGIVFRSTTESRLLESAATRNARAGIALVDSTENTVRNAAVSHNGGDGLVLERAARNDLSALTSSGDPTGITLVYARENRLSDVSADQCAFAGVALGYALRNELAEVTVSNTEGTTAVMDDPSAIWLYSASENRFDDVTSIHNDVWTIYARNGSVENRFADLMIDGSEPLALSVTDVAVDRHGNVSERAVRDEPS